MSKLFEGENMKPTNDQPGLRLIVCRCRHCDGGIEFEANQAGETVACPHCGLETLLFVPMIDQVPPVINSLVEQQPVWFGSEASTVEIRLISGAMLKIKALRLYDASELNDLAAQKAQAAELLDGVSSPYAAWGSPGWVVFASTVTGMIEKKLSREAAQKGIELIQKLAEREQILRKDVKFFPVGQIQEIENPVPSLWRVPLSSGFVHSGEEFVTLTDSEGVVQSIRWSSVENYIYHANK
jgi:hypothetical protein